MENPKGSASSVAAPDDYPRLLFVCDLPPCHLNGGPILMHRLLAGYPAGRLTVACGAGFMQRASGTLLPCRHVPLFRTTGTGRWGLGRIRQMIDLVALGPNVYALERLMRETQAEAVLTVAHETLFIAAVQAARRAGKPSVVVVHDDWMWIMRNHTWIPQVVAPKIFGRTLKRATHVYAVSDGVQEWLRDEFQVDSEVQLPCADAGAFAPGGPHHDGTLRITFAGAFNYSTAAGLSLLVSALQAGAIGNDWVLELYGVSPENAAGEGWQDPRVKAHGWRSQKEVHAAMAGANLLFVPFAFDALARVMANRQFPSKMADYLAARRPILVCAPPDTAITRYVHRWDCAELVEEPSAEAVGAALRRVISQPRQQQLLESGWNAYSANHDVGRIRADLVSRLRQLSGKD